MHAPHLHSYHRVLHFCLDCTLGLIMGKAWLVYALSAGRPSFLLISSVAVKSRNSIKIAS